MNNFFEVASFFQRVITISAIQCHIPRVFHSAETQYKFLLKIVRLDVFSLRIMKCNVEQRRHSLIATYYQLHNDSINVRRRCAPLKEFVKVVASPSLRSTRLFYLVEERKVLKVVVSLGYLVERCLNASY